jgi:hypothetical protein
VLELRYSTNVEGLGISTFFSYVSGGLGVGDGIARGARTNNLETTRPLPLRQIARAYARKKTA